MAALTGLWFAVSRSSVLRRAAAGLSESGGIFREGRVGIGMLILVIGSVMEPLGLSGARASFEKLNRFTLVKKPMPTERAGWGRPARISGPKYARFTPKVTGTM